MEIRLEKWSPGDREELASVCNQADRSYLSDRMPYPYTVENADWWLNMVSDQEGKNGIFRSIRADGVIVGNITVERKTDVYWRDGEIGYLLNRDQWSKGIMTRAVGEICRIAFEELDLLRITGLVYAPNIASRRVLEKNGFTLEGILRNGVTKGGKVYDLCVYGKLRSRS